MRTGIFFPISEQEKEEEEEAEEEEEVRTRIIFASRTHSQISQFVGEVARSPFGAEVRVCTLASRQQTCIHQPVARLPTANLINEKSLSLSLYLYLSVSTWRGNVPQ